MLHFGGEFVPAGAHQLAARMAQAQQMAAGCEQGFLIGACLWPVALSGIAVQLLQGACQFPLGLQQQSLGIACQFSRGQQVAAGKLGELLEAGAQLVGEPLGQCIDALRERFQCLHGFTMTKRIAAAEVVLDVPCQSILELLGQFEIAGHQQIGPLEGALRPPQRCAERQADRNEQQGVDGGNRLQAHRRLLHLSRLAMYGYLMSVM